MIESIGPTALGVTGLFLSVAIIGFLGTIFWGWMLVDVLKREKFEDKLIWVIVIVFLHFIGALLYYFIIYKKKKEKYY